MAKIRSSVAYTFDDVLLVPKYSEILPTQTTTTTILAKDLILDVPILSSAMDTVTEWKLARAMSMVGGLGVLHKNMSVLDQVSMVKKVKSSQLDNIEDQEQEQKFSELFSPCKPTLDDKKRFRVAAAVGVSEQEKQRVQELINAEVDLLVVDTAHGHSQGVIAMVNWIKKTFPKTIVAVGNVATAQGATDLVKAGADIIKIGIGPGSICTTRVVAGVGVPQLQAVMDCFDVVHQYKKTVIADGGIRYSGDMVKAIAAGANAVMMGSILAGTIEAPGEILEVDGKKYKAYRGMGSLGAMISGSKDRYGQSDISKTDKLVPEGVEGIVPCSGNVYEVLYKMWGGLRSGLGYLGAKNLLELQEKAEFVPITNAGKIESYPHSLLNHKDIFKK
jgi:IMP dehydrogenase